jgi:hypothetical protein
MAEDFIDEMQKEARMRFGKELSPAEAADEFALHNFEARIQHLNNLKTDDAMSVREAAKRLSFERALKETHHRLRKVDR